MTWAEARSAGVLRAAMHKRFPQKSALARRRFVPVQPPGYGDRIRLDAKFSGLQSLHEADRGPFLAPVEPFAPAAGQTRCASGAGRCGALIRNSPGNSKRSGVRRSSRIRIGADGAHQAQGLA
jgi:hypothetical protein